MDAHAHLLSLGWAGPGHALDSRPSLYKQKGHRGLAYDPLKVGNTGSGLVKPLLISRRKDRFGIGKKAHEPSKGNEWWLKGFESALENIGKDETERKKEEANGGVSRVLLGRAGEKYGGLYGFFIKGQIMEGSLGKGWEGLVNGANGSRKRKSDVLDEDSNSSTSLTDEVSGDTNLKTTKKKKRRTQKQISAGLEISPVRRPAETIGAFAAVGAFMAERDKNEKRTKKMDAVPDADQFVQIGAFFGEREKTKSGKRTEKEKTDSKKKRKSEALGELNDQEINGDSRSETKEERRERRRKRKEEKQQQQQQQQVGSVNEHLSRPKNPDGRDEEDDIARKARKAEKKRRKAEKLANEVPK